MSVSSPVSSSLIVKKIKLLYNWLMSDPMEDRVKVDKQSKKLGKSWTDVKGFMATNKFKFLSGRRRGKLNSTRGFPLKAFINQNTGEVRIYTGTFFTKDAGKS